MASDRKILADEMMVIKARVRAEMLRRQYSGPLTAYGGAAYDYSVQSGDRAERGHYDKNLVPLRAANPSGMPAPDPRYATESEMIAVEGRLTLMEARPVYGGTNDCASGCTGMCTGCQGTCTSCTSCSGMCSGCDGGCDGCTGTSSGGGGVVCQDCGQASLFN